MKILITGGAGFVASSTAEKLLLDPTVQIVLVDNFLTGLKEKACEDWCEALLKGNTISASHLEKNCEKYPSPCLLSK